MIERLAYRSSARQVQACQVPFPHVPIEHLASSSLSPQSWLSQHDLAVLIADGEGLADPRLIQWANAGLLDVIQYEICSYGIHPLGGAWPRAG
jgi:hypothetical protein